MKRLSVAFLFLLLFIQPIFPQVSLGIPTKTAQPSAWLFWFKSLRMPTKEDIVRAKAYVDSKWRCMRYGKNCSRKEQAVLVTLSAIVTAVLIRMGVKFSKKLFTPKINSVSNDDIKVTKELESWKIWKTTIKCTIKNLDFLGFIQIRECLTAKIHPDFIAYNARPILIVAAQEGWDDIVKLLLKNEANPNITDYHGNTALIYAAQNAVIVRSPIGKRSKTIMKSLLENKNFDMSAHYQGVETTDILNKALKQKKITSQEYHQIMRIILGPKEYKTFSRGKLPLPHESIVQKLPPEIMGKIYEYTLEEPLSKKQQKKLMKKSSKK